MDKLQRAHMVVLFLMQSEFDDFLDGPVPRKFRELHPHRWFNIAATI